MQSMNEETLTAIKRKNISIPKLKNILTKANMLGIRSYTEFIIGMPYETLNTWIDGFGTIIEAGQHSHLEAWFCQILNNSEMASPESIAKHKIETTQVYDYIGAVGNFDDIDEEYCIVRSTKYMPFKDLIDGYMFAWLIINFHIKGWTQIYSRFNRKYNNQSYKDFYLDLWDKVKNNNDIVGKEYKRMYGMVKTYLTKGRIDTWVPGSQLLYDSVDVLFKNDVKLKEFLKQTIMIDNHKLKDDVIKLQDHYTITPYQTYPIQLNLNYNLAEYITRDTNLKQEKTIYNLTLPDTKYLRHIHKEKHLNEWYAMLFYRNKTGWGKTFIKDDFNQYF